MIDEKIKINILVVDHDSEYCKLLKLYLENKEHLVQVVNNSKDAVNLVNAEYFDLIISDIDISDSVAIDGLKFLSYVKEELHLSTEVIITSKTPTLDVAVSAMRKGAFDFFEKPFSFLKLNNVLEKIVYTKYIKKVPINLLGLYRNTNLEFKANELSTVLVVDDDPDIRQLLKAILESENYKFFESENTKEAELLMKTIKPDIILLDVMMPGENGIDFGKRIKTDDSFFDIPILILSAKCSVDDYKTGLDSCADDYLSKPFNTTILLSKIKALLRVKKILSEFRVYTDNLIRKLEEKDSLRKYLSKETMFFMQLNKSLEINEKAEIIKNHLPKILDIELFSIFLITNDKLKLFSHNHKEIVNELSFEDIRHSPINKVMLTQKPLLIENFEETEYYHQDRKDKYKKKSSIILPLIIYNKLIGIANLNNRISGEFDTLFLEHITRTFEHISNSIENSMLFKQMEKMAVTDELTKIYNRRYFFDLLSKEASKFERYKRPFVILMIDIDNFKNFNDSYGHINGDKILKIFAQLISENIREFDIFARYGGEEFVLLLSEVDIKTGEETAERLRKVIEENCYICCNNKKVGITISGGLTEYHFGQSPEDVLNKADKALYKSKKSGKNMISLGE